MTSIIIRKTESIGYLGRLVISNLSFGKSKKPGIVFGQGLDYSNNIDISSTSNSQSIEKKHEEGTSKKLVEGGGFFNFGGKI